MSRGRTRRQKFLSRKLGVVWNFGNAKCIFKIFQREIVWKTSQLVYSIKSELQKISKQYFFVSVDLKSWLGAKTHQGADSGGHPHVRGFLLSGCNMDRLSFLFHLTCLVKPYKVGYATVQELGK